VRLLGSGLALFISANPNDFPDIRDKNFSVNQSAWFWQVVQAADMPPMRVNQTERTQESVVDWHVNLEK